MPAIGDDMTEISGANTLEPTTQDDRTMASLAHGLSVLGFLAPLIIFLIKRQSRFVSFHSLQALLWHVTYLALIFLGVFLFGVIFVFIIIASNSAQHGNPPIAAFVLFPVLWLGLALGGITNVVLAVVYAIKAGQGEWANYPIFGKWARRLLKMPN